MCTRGLPKGSIYSWVILLYIPYCLLCSFVNFGVQKRSRSSRRMHKEHDAFSRKFFPIRTSDVYEKLSAMSYRFHKKFNRRMAHLKAATELFKRPGNC